MPPPFRRIVWIVLDSVGIGAMPDATAYGDQAADTLGNIARLRPLRLPSLELLGLGNIRSLRGVRAVEEAQGAYGKCALASPGKDTTTGHWEMCGILLDKPLPLFPEGFPPNVIADFIHRTGRGVLGNKAASGTEIISQLGEEHLRTGKWILYTSADSVFQIAAHQAAVPLQELYRACAIAREILDGPYRVGRVIARPFTGEPGAFQRTTDRHDFALPPPAGMLLDRLAQANVPVTGIGKISDIFLGRGIARSIPTKGNADGMAQTIEAMRVQPDGLLFVNLVDFDSLYGHRNDVEGYAQALEAFDRWLSTLSLAADDLLMITADHGCDPTTPSTDHSREYTPLLATGARVRGNVDLGTRSTLSDIGQTVASNFHTSIEHGTSFLKGIQL